MLLLVLVAALVGYVLAGGGLPDFQGKDAILQSLGLKDEAKPAAASPQPAEPKDIPLAEEETVPPETPPRHASPAAQPKPSQPTVQKPKPPETRKTPLELGINPQTATMVTALDITLPRTSKKGVYVAKLRPGDVVKVREVPSEETLVVEYMGHSIAIPAKYTNLGYPGGVPPQRTAPPADQEPGNHLVYDNKARLPGGYEAGNWPSTVTITRAERIKYKSSLSKGYRTVVLDPGTVVRLRAVKGESLIISYLGQTAAIPASATDLAETMQAYRREAVSR